MAIITMLVGLGVLLAFTVLGGVLAVFLVSGIPAFLLLMVFFICRSGRRRKKQQEKMNVQDL